MANTGFGKSSGTIDTNSSPLEITPRESHSWEGRFVSLYASGTFDTGTLALYASPTDDFADALPVNDSDGTALELTAADILSFQIRAQSLWIQVTGGGGSLDIDWYCV